MAIGRALIAAPALLLADEPTGSLDRRGSQEIMALLKISREKYRQTIVIVTHDRDIARQADRRVELRDGRLAGEW